MRQFSAPITGVGSVPHPSWDKAIEYSLGYDIPFLPQTRPFDTPSLKRIQEFAHAVPENRPIKLQFFGPWTKGLGKWELVCKDIESQIRNALRAIAPRAAPVHIFLDEPELFKGPPSAYWEWLAHLAREIPLGVHCCSDADWESVFAAGVKIVSFDFSLSRDSILRAGADAFCEAGGQLCIGWIPTDRPRVWRQRAERYRPLLEEFLSDHPAIAATAWLSPACGLAGFSVADAEAIRGALKLLS